MPRWRLERSAGISGRDKGSTLRNGRSPGRGGSVPTSAWEECRVHPGRVAETVQAGSGEQTGSPRSSPGPCQARGFWKQPEHGGKEGPSLDWALSPLIHTTFGDSRKPLWLLTHCPRASSWTVRLASVRNSRGGGLAVESGAGHSRAARASAPWALPPSGEEHVAASPGLMWTGVAGTWEGPLFP